MPDLSFFTLFQWISVISVVETLSYYSCFPNHSVISKYVSTMLSSSSLILIISYLLPWYGWHVCLSFFHCSFGIPYLSAIKSYSALTPSLSDLMPSNLRAVSKDLPDNVSVIFTPCLIKNQLLFFVLYRRQNLFRCCNIWSDLRWLELLLNVMLPQCRHCEQLFWSAHLSGENRWIVAGYLSYQPLE